MNPADFARFAEILSEATLLVDGSGVILGANHAAAALLGRATADLVGAPLANFTSEGEANVAELLRIGSRSPQPTLGALGLRAAQGDATVRTRCEIAAVRPRSDAEPALLSVRLFDRHEVVDRFLLLNQRIEDLSREIARRRAAEEQLGSYSEQLVEASRRKDQFLAMLAHELRNPLAPMVLGVELLASMPSDEPRLERVVTMMRRQLGHLTRLVDDLLDVARLTHGKIELRRQLVPVDELLRQAAEMFRQGAERQDLRLQVQPMAQPVEVEVDAVRMVQVFGNLLSNAIKFSRRGGKIVVSARPADAGVAVSVRDDGVGIGAELLPSIFDPFVQADRSLDRQHGGLGIGLAVVRQMVELHGGSVSAHSGGDGQGTEMIVWLPVPDTKPAATAASAGASGTGGSGPLPRLRVLVVEDNPDTAEALRDIVDEWGHEVACVGDAPAALALWPEWQPDVGLLDIGLPGMSGHELARRCRPLAGGRPLLLLALTGYGAAGDVQASREAGFDDHLVKPVDLDRLRRRLASHAASLPETGVD